MGSEETVLGWGVYKESIKRLLQLQRDLGEIDCANEEIGRLIMDKPTWLGHYEETCSFRGVQDAELDAFETDTSVFGGSWQRVIRYKNGLYVIALSIRHKVFESGSALEASVDYNAHFQDVKPCPGAKAKHQVKSDQVICNLKTPSGANFPVFCVIKGSVCEVNYEFNSDSLRWFVIISPPSRQKCVQNIAQIATPFLLVSSCE